jgi:excisionase family DNA binding protein
MMKEKTADTYISVQSVAEILSCTDKYVYAMIQEGSLKAIKLGQRALRVSERSLQQFINANVVNPEDYFSPKELSQEPRSPKVVRSNWMQK